MRFVSNKTLKVRHKRICIYYINNNLGEMNMLSLEEKRQAMIRLNTIPLFEEVIAVFGDDETVSNFRIHEMSNPLYLRQAENTYVMSLCGFDGTLILVKNDKLLSHISRKPDNTSTSENSQKVIKEFIAGMRTLNPEERKRRRVHIVRRSAEEYHIVGDGKGEFLSQDGDVLRWRDDSSEAVFFTCSGEAQTWLFENAVEYDYDEHYADNEEYDEWNKYNYIVVMRGDREVKFNKETLFLESNKWGNWEEKVKVTSCYGVVSDSTKPKEAA